MTSFIDLYVNSGIKALPTDPETPTQGQYWFNIYTGKYMGYLADPVLLVPPPVEVKSLLHFDGANGSTVFTDETGIAWTANGNAQIDTAQSRFGIGSLVISSEAGYLSTSSAPDLTTGSYTIECFYLPTANVVNNADNVLATNNNTGVARYILDCYMTTNDTMNIRIVTLNNVVALTFTYPHTLGNWAHMSWVNNTADNTFKMFVNGNLVGTHTAVQIDLSSGYQVGKNAVWNGGAPYYIDEFMLTDGVAKYGSSFTPPVVPFYQEKLYTAQEI